MRRRPILWILLVITGLILAACGSPAASPGGSDDGNPPDTQSEEPAASEGGGDGGNGGNGGNGGFGSGSGSVQYEISGGGVDDSGELPFAGNFAYFQQAGVTFLVFTEDTDADEANGLILVLSDDGNVLQYITDDLVIPTATCDWNIDHNDASGAAGTFDCNDVTGFGTDGGIISGISVSGSFDVDI